MTTTEIISLLALIVATVGGILAWLQWRKSNSLKRAEFLNEMLNKLFFDKELLTAIHKIDHDEIKFKPKRIKGKNPHEAIMDTLYSYLNYICYLYEVKLIKEDELVSVKYIVYRVAGSIYTKEYFEYLDKWARRKNLTFPFPFLEKHRLSAQQLQQRNTLRKSRGVDDR